MDEDGYFGTDVAATYDADHTGDGNKSIKSMTALLREYCVQGRALEFAIGTGRIALPLQETGVEVAGIEQSHAMVSQLRQKAGGADIPVAMGDMTSTRVDGAFDLVFLIYNTIDNLTTQDAQVACFQNAADHLKSGGHFVIETQVPPIQRIPFGERLSAFARDDGHWGIDEFDIVSQTYRSSHIWVENGQARQLSIPFRYAWPAEFDLMARLAGMTLQERWADSAKTPFDARSQSHVSVWQKA